MRAIRLLICAGYWGLLTVLLLAPNPAAVVGLRKVPVFPWGDIGIHFTAFTILTLLVYVARWPKGVGWPVSAVLVAFGITTESLQWFVPSRAVELLDYTENILGVVAGTGICWLAHRLIQQRRVALAENSERIEQIPLLPRIVAFVVLAVAGAGIVWAKTVFGSPVVLVAVLGTCVVAYVAGRLIGVPFRSTAMAAAASAGLFEGGVLGANHYGWLGAVAGAVAGVLAVHLAAVPVVFVMVLFGFARQNDGS